MAWALVAVVMVVLLLSVTTIVWGSARARRERFADCRARNASPVLQPQPGALVGAVHAAAPEPLAVDTRLGAAAAAA